MSKTISSNTNKQYSYDELTGKLGSGAFASVYKGIALENNETIAIKVISKSSLKRYGDEILDAIGSEVNIL